MENCMLAKSFETGKNIDGWFMSEKLDGIRAIWDGNTFVSRNKKIINAPAWFTGALPKSPLDGELFAGRGSFQECCSIVKRKIPDDRWHDIKYIVFAEYGSPLPFRKQVDRISDLLKDSPVAIPAPQSIVHSGYENVLKTIVSLDGEGLMFRNPETPYEFKRSDNLLKLKMFSDAEAIVVGYEDGMGKHVGRLGALVCIFDGKRFKIGTGLSDEDRIDPPKIGSSVTFRYQGLTKSGVPRFPSFVCVRDYE